VGAIIYVALAVVWIAYLVPRFVERRNQGVQLDADDPTERFSDSIRFLRTEGLGEDDSPTIDGSEVSTPLTRRAQLAQLRQISRDAAKRRRRVMAVLLAATTGLVIAWSLNALPWWPALIPATLLVVFLCIARFSVVAMQRKLDARAARLVEGWDEETGVLDLKSEESPAIEFSVDLTGPAEAVNGSLWEPIPITSPTYVSKPLVPRTVRTIDLSAPESVVRRPVVPTADPLEDTESMSFDELDAAGETEPSSQRAVGE